MKDKSLATSFFTTFGIVAVAIFIGLFILGYQSEKPPAEDVSSEEEYVSFPPSKEHPAKKWCDEHPDLCKG